jgi:hypothetical protein
LPITTDVQAPPDAFDLPAPAADLGELVEPPAVPWARLAAVGVAGLGVAWLFRFPPWALIGLPFAAVVSQVLQEWRLPRRIAWTAVAAAYLAQIGDMVVSPITWWLRFGFFFVLIGAAVVFFGLRMDEFDR